MQSLFWIEQEKCRACRVCEMACSFFKQGEFNPARSRIRSERWEDPSFLGKNLTRVCQQCTPPTCMAVCPTGAITLDSKSGAILVDYALCNGCGLCVNECPTGSIRRDPESGDPLVCDLCQGEPKCAQWCPANAINYVPATWSNLIRKREISAALLSLVREAAKHSMEG